ncbi:hypothetical protein J008_02350 [Cryptococcus neoformans]|uniref:Uncharacterized protein n=2 Tax=Cryptococcus neoformans TaxID=5207 RepID=A0A854QDK6_CRYNE|nr:hypothetical protein CNAG_05236 [Cryptococcus neoformans var. grubii H99]AUB24152.1 hypothetical protein CKF44_05236 [Cryptococcus neoformans var. grubii]OWT40203.1 hypothetical protein C362_01981 [Cryptococcus neoformans var. grubii Bt1]OWZ32848.1 hypothetical protein C347_02644 [Cryptococcus neoformans var. grubii AD2-60a]OWZ45142.1 hypothetical protein C343_02576 [Cryptococcus neoformans var. grubii C23]OWZ45831.1 hypothetical protein C353_02479 [Cryptococcus neoformans var. grubii AD1-8|eukprot:XP_012048550.1 hypothetical protein CNAG_05236 [Cryptococcus neoformans var. grubii H99]
MSTTMVPVPQEELPVLEALINIRNRLTALKKDTTRFIRAPDVMPIYNSVVKQITRLNAIRDEQQQSHSALNPAPGSSTKPPPPPEANRVDQLLADVFGLLSLFFLTVGKSRETPAIYCQIASMRQILSHMDESGAYTEQFLIPFRERLDQLRSVIKQDSLEGKHPEPIVRLMIRKLEGVERQLDELFQSLTVLSVELVPIHQRLVQLRKELAALAAEPKPNKAEYKAILEELRKTDSKRVDGKFLGPGGSSVPEGQALLSGLLETCFEITQDIKAREAEEEVGPSLKPIYDRLSEMKNQLDQMTLTHRWTLRETDLYNYAMALREIDAMRVDGKFVDADGNKAEGQYALMFLLRRCYGLIYRLMSESEPISEELLPIANKLSTIKKCLNEVLKYGGPYTPRDLYPYHLALHQIDSLRKDGKFYADDGSIPEGQAILVAQLSEAHELLEMLKESMSDGESDDD